MYSIEDSATSLTVKLKESPVRVKSASEIADN